MDYVLDLRKLDIPVLWFCDSDVPEINSRKQEVLAARAAIVDWTENDDFETALFRHAQSAEIKKLIVIAQETIMEREDISANDARTRLFQSISAHFKRDAESEIAQDHLGAELRLTLGKVATINKKEWFKTITRGQKVGSEILPALVQYPPDNVLKKRFDQISQWIDHV